MRKVQTAVVGAGLQSIALCTALLRSDPLHNLAVIDPHEFMGHWYSQVRPIGMDSMRSLYSHHLGENGKELVRLELSHDPTRLRRGRTPSLYVFNTHTRRLVREYNLQERRIPATVVGLEESKGGGGGFVLHLQGGDTQGQVIAERVVLAIGLGKPNIPGIPGADHPLVRHVADFHVPLRETFRQREILVVGGGLTAATVAVSLSWSDKVTMAVRSFLRVRPFDFNPRWFANYHLWFFESRNLTDRVRLLSQDDTRGSITQEYWDRLWDASRRKKLLFLEKKPVTRFAPAEEGRKVEAWSGETNLGSFDYVLLCTGYVQEVEAIPFLQPLLGKVETKTGYPVVNSSLELLPGLHVMGNLATLKLGHAAPNIFGARLAARRLVPALVRSTVTA